LVQCTSH